jgi:ribosomal protein L30E
LLLDDPLLVIVSKDIPGDLKESLEYYCRLASVPLKSVNVNSVDFGSSLARAHAIASVSVLDEGESNILGA